VLLRLRYHFWVRFSVTKYMGRLWSVGSGVCCGKRTYVFTIIRDFVLLMTMFRVCFDSMWRPLFWQKD